MATPTPTVVAALTDAFNAGDYDAALAWIADDAVNHAGGDAPTGRAVDVIGMDMVRVAGGKVVEHWAFADAAAMAEQLSSRS